MSAFTPTPLNCAVAGPVSALEHSALRQWFASLGAVGTRSVTGRAAEKDTAAVIALSTPSEQSAISPSPAAHDDDSSPAPAA
ncbi:hypothetical protein [Opitutus terrae]|uniref:Uncharacterized protein n=1 Tax=Opitutus terrae (strain DSM 11246 / JCM 15787 / PB90-1) TaxID=452637 RepID=B1ZR43_OPITP|nr:hypothetical protein [Opitutus terrae]ACB73710.1 hypothetical protein Oter_0420 [Opitutus terrae PB90-1]